MSATCPYVFRDGPALTATLTATRRRSRFCLQPRVHPVDGVGTLAGDRLDRVEVDLSRRAEARVPHRALDPLRCHLLGGEVAAEGVAEVVQPDRPDPGRLADLPPLAVDVARLDRRADRRREHQVEIIRPYRGGEAHLLLLQPPPLKALHRGDGQGDGLAGRPGLQALGHQPALPPAGPGVYHLAADALDALARPPDALGEVKAGPPRPVPRAAPDPGGGPKKPVAPPSVLAHGADQRGGLVLIQRLYLFLVLVNGRVDEADDVSLKPCHLIPHGVLDRLVQDGVAVGNRPGGERPGRRQRGLALTELPSRPAVRLDAEAVLPVAHHRGGQLPQPDMRQRRPGHGDDVLARVVAVGVERGLRHLAGRDVLLQRLGQPDGHVGADRLVLVLRQAHGQLGLNLLALPGTLGPGAAVDVPRLAVDAGGGPDAYGPAAVRALPRLALAVRAGAFPLAWGIIGHGSGPSGRPPGQPYSRVGRCGPGRLHSVLQTSPLSITFLSIPR